MTSTTAVTNSGERRRVRARKPLRNDRSRKRIKIAGELERSDRLGVAARAAVKASPASIQ